MPKEGPVTAMRELLQTPPWEGHVDREALANCIGPCPGCAGTGTSCADACLSEEQVAELRRRVLRLTSARLREPLGGEFRGRPASRLT